MYKLNPKVEFLDKTKKKKIIEILEKDYGISELPYLLIKTGKEKIRAYSGSLSWPELNEFAKSVHVELIGSQLCTIENENSRINFDAINIPAIKHQISKNIVEINETQLNDWIRGKNLEISTELKSQFVLIKHQGDFFGVASN